jgi:hypothetical protein
MQYEAVISIQIDKLFLESLDWHQENSLCIEQMYLVAHIDSLLHIKGLQ